MPDVIGTIYKLTFPNGKVYIGQTVQKLRDRLSQHKQNALKRKKDSNLLLYNAIRKYGWENIVKEVLFETYDLDQLTEYEINYQIEYNCLDRASGYNVYLGRKMGKGKPNSKSYTPIVCYDLNNNFIKEYQAIKDVEVDGFSAKCVSQCVVNHNLSHKNRIWRYKNNTRNIAYRSIEDRVTEEEKQRRAAKAREKAVLCYNLNGKIIAEYSSVKEAAFTLNYCASNIAKVARGVKKTYKNCIWKYKGEE